MAHSKSASKKSKPDECVDTVIDLIDLRHALAEFLGHLAELDVVEVVKVESTQTQT